MMLAAHFKETNYVSVHSITKKKNKQPTKILLFSKKTVFFAIID